MNHRSALLAAGILGATGVAFGAFGAHALRDWLVERGTANTWETAARYQLVHAIALVAAALWLKLATGSAQRRISWAALCWVVGIVLFSGSLYGLAAGGPRWLGPVTPLGGVALLAGWGWICGAALAKDN